MKDNEKIKIGCGKEMHYTRSDGKKFMVICGKKGLCFDCIPHTKPRVLKQRGVK